MSPNRERSLDERSYFYRNPLLLQMHQQEIRLRATVEAIRDSHLRQLEAMEKHRTFIENFYDSHQFQEAIRDCIGVDSTRSRVLSGGRTAIYSYLQGLGIDTGIDESVNDLDALFRFRGIFDQWYVKKIDSFKESFDQAIGKIFELQNNPDNT